MRGSKGVATGGSHHPQCRGDTRHPLRKPAALTPSQALLFLQDAALRASPHRPEEQHPLLAPDQSGKGESRMSRENKTVEGMVATMSEGQVFLS